MASSATDSRVLFIPFLFVAKLTAFFYPHSRYVRKGVPSLFSILKPLYAQPANAARVAIIGKIVKDHAASLEEKKCFSGEEQTAEPPTSHLWVLYYLAQHYMELDLLVSIRTLFACSHRLPAYLSGDV